MRTLCALRETQAADVLRKGGEARGGKSRCTKHQPQTRMLLAPPVFCPAAQQLLGLVTPHIQLPLPTKPCSTVQPLSNTPNPSLCHLSFLFDVKSHSATNRTTVDY